MLNFSFFEDLLCSLLVGSRETCLLVTFEVACEKSSTLSDSDKSKDSLYDVTRLETGENWSLGVMALFVLLSDFLNGIPPIASFTFGSSLIFSLLDFGVSESDLLRRNSLRRFTLEPVSSSIKVLRMWRLTLTFLSFSASWIVISALLIFGRYFFIKLL